MTEFLYFSDDVCFLGDLNADFRRASTHCNLTRHFIDELQLIGSWDTYDIDFTHNQEVDGSAKFTVLDHIFWTESLQSKITNAGVFHSPDNLSDHSPVYCEIMCDISPDSSSTDKSFFIPKPKWKLASPAEKTLFKQKLNDMLKLIDVPTSVFSCNNVHCEDDRHIIDSDIFMSSILNAIEIAAYECLPLTKMKRLDEKSPVLQYIFFIPGIDDIN